MATKFSLACLTLSPRVLRQSRTFTRCPHLLVRQTNPLMKVKIMEQVDVDEADIQKRLGKLNMNLVRKAEKRVEEKAKRHKFYRQKDWIIAGTCLSLVVAIYSYTLYAIKQEKFLDDFDMPDEIDRTKESS